jgi:hypothetical protein
MTSWAEFEASAPDFGEAGRRLFAGTDGLPIGFLATVTSDGRPHISPVCPIFCADDLYVCAAERTPKIEDLRASGDYALHAFLADGDEEFQVAGRATQIADHTERSAVHEAIPFQAFNRQDPIFRLSIDRALWVHWERVGQPDTEAIRKRWPSQRGGR